jgi:hypothetical protein
MRLPTLPKPRPSCMPATIAGLRSRGHAPTRTVEGLFNGAT